MCFLQIGIYYLSCKSLHRIFSSSAASAGCKEDWLVVAKSENATTVEHFCFTRVGSISQKGLLPLKWVAKSTVLNSNTLILSARIMQESIRKKSMY